MVRESRFSAVDIGAASSMVGCTARYERSVTKLALQIRRVWQKKYDDYEASKVWRQTHRQRQKVARCTEERLGIRWGYGCCNWQFGKDPQADLGNANSRESMKRQSTAEYPNLLYIAGLRAYVHFNLGGFA